MRYFSLLIFSLLSLAGFGQDIYVYNAAVNPNPATVGGTVFYSVDFQNIGTEVIPDDPTGFDLTRLNFSTSRFQPTLTAGGDPIVSGSIAPYFDWEAYCITNCSGTTPEIEVWQVNGWQNSDIPAGVTGNVIVEGIAIYEATQADADANKGVGFNVNMTPRTKPVDPDKDNNDVAVYVPTQEQLPVELSSFSAEASGSDAVLKWVTASEQNNSHFLVQRSKDGASFSTVGQVASQSSNSSSRIEYNYTDKNVLNGGAVYYRLEQVDFDGSSSVSDIKVVNGGNSAAPTKVFPNPVKRGQQVAITAGGINTVSIVGTDGRVILQKTYDSGTTKANIGTESLAAGSYSIIVNNKENKKIVVVE